MVYLRSCSVQVSLGLFNALVSIVARNQKTAGSRAKYTKV